MLSTNEPNVEAVKHAVLKRLEEKLEPLARNAQVRAVHLTLEPWTVASGLLTPTLKVRRAPLEVKYGSEIAKLYTHHSPSMSAARQATGGEIA
jgi:long-chain acyl-CoA synthetase